jgi:N-acetylmuramoyl-L-alanine amidase CwlA
MIIEENIIKINEFSRPGKKRTLTRNVVWHYTANPGASADNHVRYFGETIANQNPNDNEKDTYASAHVFIDRVKTLVIIPLDEVAYHATAANPYSIGVELCIEEDGSFHPETIRQAIEFGAKLAKDYTLNPLTDYIRHFDVTGKICPKPWVDDPAAWDDFKKCCVEGDEPKLAKWVASTIYFTWIKPAWEKANESGDQGTMNDMHLLASELRKACGMKEDEDFV